MESNKELKPCPFCGGMVSSGKIKGEPYIVYHKDKFCEIRDNRELWDVTVQDWNNAYCWKEIESLQSRLEKAEEKLAVAREALENIQKLETRQGHKAMGCSEPCYCALDFSEPVLAQLEEQ